MIEVHYFARFRELLDCESESIDFDSNLNNAEQLMLKLSTRGGSWSDVFNEKNKIMIAINQEMVHSDTLIQDGDEVAFFPPVTGG